MAHDTAANGFVLGSDLRELAQELAEVYLRGELVLVAGAGDSRASGMPGWDDMVACIQEASLADLPDGMSARDLEAVLAAVHQNDPISRADTLRRLTTARVFHARIHAALYGGLPPGEPYRPSAVHWQLASFADRRLMPDIFTSNYDDLLEDAKQALRRSGRVRHFHGRLPQAWAGSTNLGDPPVVTSRDYADAESNQRYEKIMDALENKTALLVGFSLSDPNLVRLIHQHARDCRAIVVASPGRLTPAQQRLRLSLLRRYWQGLKIGVSAIEAHEELPAFLLALRRNAMRKQGLVPAAVADRALRASVMHDPWAWAGAREWCAALKQAVDAARHVAPTIQNDRTLRAGFYAIAPDGFLTHLVSSDSTEHSYSTWPRRRLKADDPRPWGAAGYCWAAGVPIASSATGAAFDRNVPDPELLVWQQQRVAQRRLPASSVLCAPAFVKYDRALVAIGVLYFSSRRGAAFEGSDETPKLRQVLEIALASMIGADRTIRGGLP